MMRIIAGKLGGRQFQAPTGHRTHPMSEKMRGALFNALGDIEGLNVLDGFAGSGALSFEAISRGATQATAIESDKKSYSLVLQNIGALQIEDRVKAIRANASGWSDNNPHVKFDLVLLDPPYDDIKPTLLEKLATHTKPGGLIVLSLPSTSDFSLAMNCDMLSTKHYGDAKLVFYKKTD